MLCQLLLRSSSGVYVTCELNFQELALTTLTDAVNHLLAYESLQQATESLLDPFARARNSESEPLYVFL